MSSENQNPRCTVYDHQGERIMSFSPFSGEPNTCQMRLHYTETDIAFYFKDEYIDSLIEALIAYREEYLS